MVVRSALFGLVGLLLALLGASPGGADLATPFDPAFDVAPSIGQAAPSGNPTITRHLTVGLSNHLPAYEELSLPPDFDVADDRDVPDGDAVGGGTLAVDADCDADVDTFSFTLLEAGTAEPDEKTNWQTAGMPIAFLMIVRGNVRDGHTVETLLFNGPLGTPYCAPLDLTIAHWGLSSSGAPVLISPETAGSYSVSATYISAPLMFPPEHQAILGDSVGIGADADTDGVADAFDNCPAIANAGQADADNDLIGDHCDSGDADGDGFADQPEAAAIGTGAGDPCGNDGWPADLFGGPLSTNRLTIQDITSFTAPMRRLDTSPGDGGFSARWDLLPGRGILPKFINIQDLTAIVPSNLSATARPPMFGGAPAFGLTCPTPP